MTSVKIESLLGMLTIKLNDDNFIKWSYQFCSVLRGYDLLDHFTEDSVCPPKFVLTPDDDAIEHVVGCKTACEAWTALQDRYMLVSKASVNHLKAELHTMQKGGDTIDKYLLRLKALKDQLQAAGEKVNDNDLIIAALTGLPSDYDMIRTVILARDSPITLKEFRAQLIGAEKTIETRVQSLVQNMAAMYVNAPPPPHGTSVHSGMSSSSSNTSQPSSPGSSPIYNSGYQSSANNF
ncbi:unnamed protein product [Malus baccata var. baccata]